MTTDFSTGGFLCPSFGNDAVSNWKPPIQGGFRQWLSQKELRIFEPLLSREVVGGWWFPEDCHINNKKLYNSLTVACKNIGVQFIRSFVDNLIYSNNILSKLRLSTGEVVAAERYVIATGCWLRKLIPLPVYPQKGQMVSLCNEKGLVPLQRVIYGDGVYIVPRKNGEIVLGATVEDHCIVDFQTSAGGIFTVLKEALRLIPSLSQLPLKQTWTGYRPTTPDLLPIFGKLWFDNVSVCAGHHRNGILLAPISGKIASRIALDITIDNSILESDILKAFSVQRFSNMEIGDQNKLQKTEELESSVENGVEQHKLQSSVSPNERKDNTVKSGQKDQAQVSEVKLWQVDQNGQLIPIYYRRPPSNLFGSEGYGDFEEQIPTISTEGGHSSNGSLNGVVAASENRKQSTFEKDSSATEWSRSTDAYLDISSGVDDENNERELRKAILANLRFHEANTESTEHSLDAGFMQSFTNESSQPYEEDELEEKKVTDEYNEWLKFYETVDTSQNIPC